MSEMLREINRLRTEVHRGNTIIENLNEVIRAQREILQAYAKLSALYVDRFNGGFDDSCIGLLKLSDFLENPDLTEIEAEIINVKNELYGEALIDRVRKAYGATEIELNQQYAIMRDTWLNNDNPEDELETFSEWLEGMAKAKGV